MKRKLRCKIMPKEMRFKFITSDQTPEKKVRAHFRDLRIEIEPKLCLLNKYPIGCSLMIDNIPKTDLNALRRWYLAHGYPQTCMRKGKLFIVKPTKDGE